jgi:ribosomal protein S1
MENKFDLETIESTFTRYKKGEMFDGVVIIKREDGAVFNIGGKNDAFLPKAEVEDYENLKIGDRFKVVITSYKNDNGDIEVSKTLADNQIISTQNANKLKLGSSFTFVVQKGTNEGLYSKMGEFEIFVPIDEISHTTKDVKKSEGKQFEATVTAIDKDKKSIIASIKILEDQTKQTQEDLFWKSIFINKIVEGKVKKILPYGAFVDVGGVDCFCHISNFSYKRITSPEEVVKQGEKYNFKVVKVDRENKKVELSKKALDISPKRQAIESLEIGQTYEGTVVKILAFGAIVNLENGASGLVHIKNATERNDQNIYEIVKLDQRVKVEVIEIDLEEEKVSFKLVNRDKLCKN